MKALCCLLFAAAAVGLAAQESQSDLVKGARNQQLNVLLTRSDQAKVMGDLPGAIKGYEDALNQARTEPDLKGREEEVLQRLAAAYIAAQRPADAVRASRRVLSFHTADCAPGAPGVERCADAEYGLGLSLMHAGDFAGAVTELNASVSAFGKVSMEGDENYRMIKTKQRGDAESLLAAALFRAGHKEKAIATFRSAIARLKVVADNPKLDPGTRGSALRSVKDAESSLKLLEQK